MIHTYKQKILDEIDARFAEINDSNSELKKADFPEYAEAYRMLKRIDDWYITRLAAVREMVRTYEPQERRETVEKTS